MNPSPATCRSLAWQLLLPLAVLDEGGG